MMAREDVEAILWTLGMIAIIVASGLVWGLAGILFAFGAIVIGWVAWKQLVAAIKRF